MNGGDPVGAEVDATGRDASEGVLVQRLDVIVVEVEVVDDQGAVEHVRGEAGDEVLAQVELVQPLLVAEVKKIFFQTWFKYFFKFC